MTFYSPWAFLALAAVPVIIILYLLKQRHQDFTVSSLFLWEEALRDLEANAPWQKLRKNLLMLLQILAVILLAFALAKPFLNSLGGEKGNVIVIIDTSLSMQAEDVGKSRFDEAKAQAAELISNLKPGIKVTLVNMGRNALILENLSSNKNSLLSKLDSLRVTNGTSNEEDVKSLVVSLIKQQPGAQVVVFSDHEFDIPGVLEDISNISNNGDNYAVTLISYSRGAKGLTVLGRVSNFSVSDATVPVSLYVDGIVFDARNVDIEKGGTSNIYWNDIPDNIKLLEVRIDREDSLKIDNSAWSAVNPSNIHKALLVTESNVFIEKVISLTNGIELFKAGIDDIEDVKGYQLYIYDGFIPEKLPDDGNVMILNPPENSLFEIVKEVENPQVEDFDDEIFQYVKDFDFSIGKTKILNIPAWGKEILRFKEGTGAFAGQYQNRRVLVAGFDIHNTDMPLTPAFPIFMTNTLNWLLPSTVRNVDSVFSGDGISFNLDPKAQEAYVTTPTGRNIKIAPPFPAMVFDDTGEAGLYTLSQKTEDGDKNFYFSVNVPSGIESDLINSTGNNTQAENPIEGSPQKPLNTGMNLQGIFLWIILLVLLIEWWVYSNGI